jgi:hypothetical protein
MAEKDKAPDTTVTPDLFASFLAEVGRLPGALLEGALRHANSDDERLVVRQLGGTFATQITELSSYISDLRSQAGATQVADANQLLRLSAATPLAASGAALADNLASPVARIGLAGIIEEVKKIIKVLAEIFHIKLPDWFNPLINLIDEIVKKILSAGSPSLARTLSAMEQDYLGELAQLARLQRESRAGSEASEEGDH